MKKQSIVELLHNGGYSCVIQKNTEVRTFRRRGVIDLYELYQSFPAFLCDALVADKVIGKGAATLLVLGKISYLHADVISTPALALLRQAHISTDFDIEVPFIINRKKNGRCPLETACDGINTPEAIYPVIQDFVTRSLHSNKM